MRWQAGGHCRRVYWSIVYALFSIRYTESMAI